MSQLVLLYLFPPPQLLPLRLFLPYTIPGLSYAALYPWNNLFLRAINLIPLSQLSDCRSSAAQPVPVGLSFLAHPQNSLLEDWKHWKLHYTLYLLLLLGTEISQTPACPKSTRLDPSVGLNLKGISAHSGNSAFCGTKCIYRVALDGGEWLCSKPKPSALSILLMPTLSCFL